MTSLPATTSYWITYVFAIIGIVSAVVLIFGVIVATKTQPPTLDESNNAKVEILGDKTHDWGNIDIEGGTVEKVFQIKNVGESNLEVTNFKTSCMCTEVKVDINGNESPSFGMHSRSSWKGIIEPGQTADVKVVFDPMFHGPQAVGPITRLASFNTNDADNPTVEFELTGNVVQK